MKEDVFNTSIRKLLKEFGVTAQREIEKAVIGTWLDSSSTVVAPALGGKAFQVPVHGPVLLGDDVNE